MECGAVSGACSGRGRGPHLSHNLWALGVMSPLSLLFHAWQRLAANSASSWQGHEATETGLAYAPVSQAHGHNHIVQCWQGGGGSRPPFLACGAALGPVPGPVPAVVCASSLTVCPLLLAPQGHRWSWMPGMPPGTAVPHPPTHRSTRCALFVLVRRADPKAGQSWPLLRAPHHCPLLWRGEERRPVTVRRSRWDVCFFGDTVLWASPCPRWEHREHFAPPLPGHFASWGRCACAGFVFVPCARRRLLCCRATLACCCWAHLAALYCCIWHRWCQTAAGRVNTGLPFTCVCEA